MTTQVSVHVRDVLQNCTEPTLQVQSMKTILQVQERCVHNFDSYRICVTKNKYVDLQYKGTQLHAFLYSLIHPRFHKAHFCS